MSFSKEFTDYGVVKIEGRRIKIYKSPSSYVSITNISEDITDARWVGDNTIVVYLKSGRVRKYRTLSNYITIL